MEEQYEQMLKQKGKKIYQEEVQYAKAICKEVGLKVKIGYQHGMKTKDDGKVVAVAVDDGEYHIRYDPIDIARIFMYGYEYVCLIHETEDRFKKYLLRNREDGVHLVTLHEVAHLIEFDRTNRGEYGEREAVIEERESKGDGGHGEEWASIFCGLIERYIIMKEKERKSGRVRRVHRFYRTGMFVLRQFVFSTAWIRV